MANALRRPVLTRFSARRRSTRYWVGAGLVVAFSAQLAVALRAQIFSSDSFHYMLLAKNLAGGAGFVSGGSQHPDLTRSPVYPGVIAAVSVMARNVELAALLVTVGSGALALLPLRRLARITLGRSTAVPAAVLGSVSCIVAVSSRALPEAVYLPLTLATVAAVRWSVLHPCRRHAAIAGALAALATLTRAEGIVWIIFGVACTLAMRTRSRPRHAGRWARAGWLCAAAGALYLPYAAWVSVRLGRWEPMPQLRYLSDIRQVADRFRLRDLPGPAMSWDDRARFLLTADREGYVLERAFATNTLPAPDSIPRVAVATEDTRGSDVARRAWRRVSILLTNLRHVPTALRDMHLIPAILVVLGSVGTFTALLRRRGRRELVFLTAALVASLLPVLSHVEGRFLFPAFSLGLVPAAAGWDWLHRASGRWFGRSVVTVGVHVGIALAVIVAMSHHLARQDVRLAKAELRRDSATWCRRHLEPGPMLALEPAIPFWSGHAYRAIPMGRPDVVLDYARAQAAIALTVEDSDLRRLPQLDAFLAETPPPGFHLMATFLRDGVGTIRVFGIAP